MQLLGIGRSEQVYHGIRAIGLGPDGVDHQSIALIVADRIALPGWRHTPERVGTDAVPGAAAGATAGAVVLLKAALATATTKVANKRKSRCIAMATSFSGSPIASRVEMHSIPRAATARGTSRLCGPDLCHNRQKNNRPNRCVAPIPTTC